MELLPIGNIIGRKRYLNDTRGEEEEKYLNDTIEEGEGKQYLILTKLSIVAHRARGDDLRHFEKENENENFRN